MIRRLLFVLVGLACLSLGCGPSRPTVPTRVHRVSLSELVRSYRTSPAERRYDGLTVQVQIPPASWTSRENYIEAHRVFEHRSGCVHLQCDPRKLSPTSGLVVTGVCKGIVRDGEPRGSGVDWYVVIDDCRVTEILWD